MPIDIACTSPADWAVKALNDRADAIANPKNSKWISRTGPWARVVSSAVLGDDASSRATYALTTGNLDTFKNSYTLSDIGGVINTFKPKPGLESIQVSYKGTMGSTKSCVVNFKVWSLEDLQIMEQLYMVPGISVIVEWGWPISSDGSEIQPCSEFLSIGADGTSTVNIGPAENPYTGIMDIILKKRKQYQGDYDGLVGVVTNFNYALNEQLGFDCSFELCAPGELWLEQSVSNVSENCIGADDTKIKKQTNLEAKFHAYFRTYEDATKIYNRWKSDQAKYSIPFPFVISQKWEADRSEYDKGRRSGVWDTIKGGYEDAKESFGVNERSLVYIGWNYFIKLLNQNINQFILTANGTPQDSSKSNPSISLAMDIIPVTILPKMYPLDPRICTFQPVSPDYDRGLSRRAELRKGFSNWLSRITDRNSKANREFYPVTTIKPLQCTPGNLVLNIKEINAIGTSRDKANAPLIQQELNKETSGLLGLLNNVYLNAEWLRGISQLTAGEQVTADDYLKKILDELNKSSGGLWNLQYIVDEKDNNLLHIYDANFTSAESRAGTLKPYEFKFKQNASPLIRNLNIESKLVDGFKSMVLYGNSTDNGGYDTTHQAMSLYSNKITDGFKIKQQINPDTNNPENTKGHQQTCENADGEIVDQTVESDPVADLDMAYAELVDDVSDDSVAAMVSAMSSYITHINTKEPKIAAKIPSNQNILLPFNCTFNLDGFSGFSWGNTVKVDYLPNRYFKQDGGTRMYFQITKINHEVSVTDWTTSIETIMRLTPEYKEMPSAPSKPQPKPTSSTPVQREVREVVKNSGFGSDVRVDARGRIYQSGPKE